VIRDAIVLNLGSGTYQTIGKPAHVRPPVPN